MQQEAQQHNMRKAIIVELWWAKTFTTSQRSSYQAGIVTLQISLNWQLSSYYNQPLTWRYMELTRGMIIHWSVGRNQTKRRRTHSCVDEISDCRSRKTLLAHILNDGHGRTGAFNFKMPFAGFSHSQGQAWAWRRYIKRKIKAVEVKGWAYISFPYLCLYSYNTMRLRSTYLLHFSSTLHSFSSPQPTTTVYTCKKRVC